jgi:hypothetical protein
MVVLIGVLVARLNANDIRVIMQYIWLHLVPVLVFNCSQTSPTDATHCTCSSNIHHIWLIASAGVCVCLDASPGAAESSQLGSSAAAGACCSLGVPVRDRRTLLQPAPAGKQQQGA